eukprot:s2976_g4.t1
MADLREYGRGKRWKEGGSKEAFHLVYQALQTLTDPAARKEHDKSLADDAATSMADPGLVQSEPKPKKKTGGKGSKGCPSATAMKPNTAYTFKTTSGQAGRTKKTAGGERGASKFPQSKQGQLLLKIHRLLKGLPRDVRKDMIQKEFSQKQRLILEKWMADTFSARDRPFEAAPMLCEAQGPPEQQARTAESSYALALPGGGTTSRADDSNASITTRCPPPGASKSMKCIKNKSQPRRRDPIRTLCGCVRKNRSLGQGGSYRARIRFDAIYIEMFSAKCDLPTALEYLLILTSVKQKMLDDTNPYATFENRLQEALISSAAEHGKCFDDLELRFGVVQGAGVFIGSELRTPILQSIGELGKIRGILEPFRKFANKNWGRRGPFRLYSPTYLQHQWTQFQEAVADTWRAAGADSSKILQKIRALYASTFGLRDKHLRAWECKRMALQDKKRRHSWDATDQNEKNRGRIGLQRSDLRRAKQLQAWERKSMSLQDKNRHRPRKWRVPVRRQQSLDAVVKKNSFALKKVLVRWERWLKKDAQWTEKQHRKLLRQRNRDREEQRRAQVLAQRHAKKEDRLRREARRKRSRFC